MSEITHLYSNKVEAKEFFRGALMWRGSITPRVLPSLIMMSCYPMLLIILDRYWQPLPYLDVTPFEYTGAVLGLVLVFRTNAGHERWWEARKLWGGINNQTRNLVIAALSYGSQEESWRKEIVKWAISFSFAAKESLRNSNNFESLNDLLHRDEISDLSSSIHKPLFVANKLSALINQAKMKGFIDGFAFHIIESQRSLLIDYIGGCERILKTPMPLVYAIKTRRFILIFLLLLPFSLIEKAGFNSVFIFFLVAYPLLSLDMIGIELQNPYNTKNLSHLPLDNICDTIKIHCLALLEQPKAHSDSQTIAR
jgi:ion channel-forming bestrophin family protein